ncbi:MAG: CARDB domain-containing protein [Candidatus Poseidoniaceae archaeon]
MRPSILRAIPALSLVLLLFLSVQTPLLQSVLEEEKNTLQTSNQDPGVSDVPVWRVGDKWVYAGTFDPTLLVTNTGVQATVGEIYGDTTTEVLGIAEQNVDNMTVLAYTLRSSANFDKSGVSLEGYGGNVYITYSQTEYLRVSDLSSLRSELDMYIRFVPYGISSLTQILGDITITTTYSPVSETYDFPLRVNEQWTTTTTSSAQWSGSSDYITPFPPPESDTNSTTWEAISVGKPRNSFGQTIGYGGCNSSYELQSVDRDGSPTGYRWYCPEVQNYAWLHTEDDIGLTIDFRLKRYIPVGATGVDEYSNPGSRDTCLAVELENPITALNSPMGVWVNASSACFADTTNLDIELRHEPENSVQTATTASNGSAFFVVNVGDARDPSATLLDWASHGIVARINPASQSPTSIVGAATVTLDEFIVGLDLIASEEFAKVLRNRSGVVTELNSLSGWNVLPGDELQIEVGVQNRGITTSTTSVIALTGPDGQTNDYPLPPLATYAAHKVNFSWIVPPDQAVGIVPVTWEADPDDVNSADVNEANDVAQLGMFVGRLPTPVLENISALTLEQVTLSAEQSFDEDGGGVTCEFEIPFDDGTRTWEYITIPSEDCSVNWTWMDDGDYPVQVTVIDEERDETQSTLLASIGNRAPKIEIRSARSEAKVEHPITLYAYANDSDSEDAWPGVVDVFWPDALCQEGYYTRVCTTTAPTEGWHTFTAVGTDDDSTNTMASIDIKFTNIAPHGTSIALLVDDTFLESDEQQIWQLDEDEIVNVRGQALDSIDDLESLTHTWWPDGQEPSLMYTYEGRVSNFPMMWSTSGLHTIRLEVSDTDGESSAINERWVNVRNVPPVIEPLVSILPIAEGQAITITGNATDTPSDRASLVRCWDVDPGIDSDDFGGADDDCDITGDVLTYAWNRSGKHTIIYHVTDDDGAQTSEVLTVEVLNMPPIVRLQNLACRAYQTCVMSAEQTIDSANDIGTLTIVWDLDITVDSNGDGIKDNDADLVGTTVQHMFRTSGKVRVKAMAWDENPERPGQATMVIDVAPPERNSIEQISAGLIGEEANSLAQFGLLIGILLLLALLTRRRKGSSDTPWSASENDMLDDVFDTPSLVEQAQARRPSAPPNMASFASPEPLPVPQPEVAAKQPEFEIKTTSENDLEEPQQGPPLPESGLPEGWTMEQWGHYGHQYVAAQGSQTMTFSENGTELK